MAHPNFREFLGWLSRWKTETMQCTMILLQLFLLPNLWPWSHASSSCYIPCLGWSIYTELWGKKGFIPRWIKSKPSVLWYFAWELRYSMTPCLSWCKLVPYLQQLCSTSAIYLISMHFLNNLIIIGEEPSLNPVAKWTKMNKAGWIQKYWWQE